MPSEKPFKQPKNPNNTNQKPNHNKMSKHPNRRRDLFIAVFSGGAFLAATALFSAKLATCYLAVSVTLFALYFKDKRTAQTHSGKGFANRVPENTLHFLSLLGGWPGALAGRILFRHKTQKRRFTALFWLTVAINIAITYAVLIHYAQTDFLSFLSH